MHISVRIVPWLIAVAGLAVPLVASGFTVWPLTLVWLAVLALVWLVGPSMVPTRTLRIVAAVVLLPVLFLLAFEGGWWLIPADLVWLAMEIADRSYRGRTGEVHA
jgi:O-antigen ligase